MWDDLTRDLFEVNHEWFQINTLFDIMFPLSKRKVISNCNNGYMVENGI